LKFESQLKKSHENSGFVHRINGAFLFWKMPNEIQEIYFDEDFFLYGEDIEWALRIKKKGWRFFHFSDIIVKHLGSASSSNQSIKLLQIELMDWLAMYKTNGIIYLKWYDQLLFFNKRLDLYLSRAKNKDSIQHAQCILTLENLRLVRSKFYQVRNSNSNYFENFNFYK
jgi:GT2 family glycosyltransferase